MNNIFIYFAFFCAFIFNFGESSLPGKWYLVAMISCVAIAWKRILPRFGALAAITFFYFVSSAVWVFIKYKTRFLDIDSWNRITIYFYSADSFARMMLIITPFIAIRYRVADLYILGSRICLAYVAANALLLIKDFIILPGMCSVDNVCGGVMANPSISTSVMMVCVPFALEQLKSINIPKINLVKVYLFWTVVIASIVLSRSSIGFGMLIAHICVSIFMNNTDNVRAALFKAAFIIAALATAGYLYAGNMFMHSNGRFAQWSYFMDKWSHKKVHWIFGSGHGTFGIFSANLELADRNVGAWWPWMHNDWLQILFESGAVGLILAISIYIKSLFCSYRLANNTLFMGIIMLGICMLLNYPVHLGFGALLCAWITTCSLLQCMEDGGLYGKSI